MIFKQNKNLHITNTSAATSLESVNVLISPSEAIFLDCTTYFGLLLIILAPLLPLHTAPIATFEVEVLSLCGLLLLCLNFFLFKLRIPKLALMPLLLACIALYHVLVYKKFSSVVLLNTLYLGYMLCFFLAIVIAYHLKRLNYELLDKLAYGLMLIGGVSTVIMLCQMWEIAAYINQLFQKITWTVGTQNVLMSAPTANNFRPFGNLNQPNHMMTFMAWSVIAWIYFGLTKLPLIINQSINNKKYIKIRIQIYTVAYWLLGILLSIGLVLPASRSLYLQALVIIVICLLCLKHRPRFALGVLCILIFGAIIALFAADYAKHAYHLKFTTLFERNQNTELASNLRSLLQQHGWLMFKQSPIFGVSYGQYSWVQFLNIHQVPNAEIANSSHNIVIDILAKTGLIGLIFVIIPMLNWVMRMFKISFDKHALNYAQALFALGIMGCFTAHAMLEYPQHYLFFIIPIGLVLGYTAQNYIAWLKQSRIILTSLMLCIAAYTTLMYLDYTNGFNKVNGTKNTNYGVILHPYMDFSNIGSLKVEDMDDAFSEIHINLAENAIHLLPSWTIIKKYSILLAKNNQHDKALNYIDHAMQYFSHENKMRYIQEIYASTQHVALKKHAAVQNFAQKLKLKYPAIKV
jgi:O-antigen ligase